MRDNVKNKLKVIEMEKDEKKLESLRKRSISNDAVELLAKMVDDNMILCRSSAMSHNSMHLYSLKGEGALWESQVPFKLTTKAFDALYSRGYIFHVSKHTVEEKLQKVAIALEKKLPSKEHGGTFLAWYDQPYATTKEGRAVMEDLRGRLIDILAERENAKESPRLLVVANYHYSGKRPGVSDVYRIISETEGRFYIAHLEGKAGPNYNPAVKGPLKNMYVQKEDVIAVDVTMEQYESMKRATVEFESSLTQATSQMEAEMQPIKRRYAQREDQLLAMLEDGLRESVQVKNLKP